TMNTITFGTTTEPLHIATAGRDQPAEEFDDKGNIDPDRLLQCPFDKNHQIRACRFPYHLIKCRKNHPKLASELKTCPYNARHLVPKHELNHHTETCEDRITVDIMDGEMITNGDGNSWQVPVSTWVNPNVTEDWDAGEIFILQEMRPTNNLGPTCRIPNTLPWPSFNP
uniref:CHHC U11-48K-type domain-containing protein n=1 Tax=Periophthalmus magnuspinnatus TaxID=409849 RepID=A0A3B4BKA5_9GOBI